jgi:3-phenylpropionate/trans-cinnamate dioxygenase ferredoxin reductase component
MNIVIVGGGLAGANAVGELRAQGYTEDITLVGLERHLPYERPPLSKGVLLGSAEPDSVFVHDRQWYDDHGVDLRLGSPAEGVDLDRCHVLVGGNEVAYDRLLLATGATPRRLPLFEDSGLEVVYLRTLDDAVRLKGALSGRILVVGAGWIGLEVTAAARLAGAEVTVVETAALPLLAVLGPELGRAFAELHRSHGVDLRLETSVAAVDGSEVVLSDGHRVRPDLVVVGIGVGPNDGLAAGAGLPTDNGVLVDAVLRTSDPHVYAAGDVANQDHPDLGRIRVEHWDNAIEQGKHAARAMLGDDAPYRRTPYFFTDQYDLGMEYVGHVGPGGHDEVIVRGDLENHIAVALWVKDDRVVAGLHLNDWDATPSLRHLVAAGAVDIEALRDSSTPLPSG